MHSIGIDIGSTASKVAVMSEGKLLHTFILPTGWNCKETSVCIREKLTELGFFAEGEDIRTFATGYGRISVPYADKTLSEITCHGVGAHYIFKQDSTIIDIGGQDTKVITIRNGKTVDFLMNDKCSAGTGKFIEIMANRLGLGIEDLCRLAETGEPVSISSMCTVFAESEIISYIGAGEKRENIALGIVDSVVAKVASLCGRHAADDTYFLTGGLCEAPIVLRRLSQKLERPVTSNPLGRYAGAVGAALMAAAG